MDRPGIDVTQPALRGARWARLQLAVSVATEPLVLLSAVQLTMLAWRLPLLDRLPGWVFATHAKAVGTGFYAVLAAIPGVALGAAWVLRGRSALAVTCLMLGGFAFQHALGWSEGRGLDGIRDRIVRSGHAEFAEVAVSQRSMWSVLIRYEQKVQGGELGRYAHSKPPGTLLTYMATERLSRLVAASGSTVARLQALRTTAAVAWPLACYVALVPLFVIVKRTRDAETALLACALYIVVPSVALVTLHTDQFLFPLLGMLAILVTLEASNRGSAPLSVLAGAWFWVIAFFTFPLLLVAPIALGCAWAGLRRTARTAAWMLAGFTIAFVVWRFAFGYDAIARFDDARRFNSAWKGWAGGAFQTLYFAWMNLLEFVLWVGIPVAALAFGRVRRAVQDLLAGDTTRFGLAAVATLVAFSYLVFFGQSKGETARLWLFVVPMFCALSADEIRVRWRASAPAVAAVVLVLQWLTVILTKTGQDFF
jgi:hypothetical protein